MNELTSSDLVGLTIEQAQDLIGLHGLCYRVTRNDAETFLMSMDLRSDRFNLELDKGLVSSASIG